MAILTISRQIGSFGDEIGKAVANSLEYSLFDKKRLYEMAMELGGDYSKEIDVLSNESRPGFFDFLFHQRSVYGNLFSAMIYECASEDNIVILGRGAQFLFRDIGHVINARVVAPLGTRVRRVSKELETDEDMAEEFVRKSDQSREEFIRYLFREEVADSKWYDIVIDTSCFTIEGVSGFFSQELRRLESQHPVTSSDRHLYKKKALEKKIEIVLMKEMDESNYIKVEADYTGNVVISGYLATDVEYKTAETLVGNVSGVSSVENRIIVSQFPVRPWY